MSRIVSSNYHVDYPDLHRHWDPQSERYAGVDCLLTRLQRGWEVADTIWAEQYWHAGTRPVTVLHFRLSKNGQSFDMPVISNPYVRRLIYMQNWEVRPLEERAVDTNHGKT